MAEEGKSALLGAKAPKDEVDVPPEVLQGAGTMVFLPADWFDIFGLEKPILELVARGSALYLIFLFITRIMPRRTGGELGMMDLIFIVLITEAASHALGDYNSIADGTVVIATLVSWNYAVNFLAYWVPGVERLVSSSPLKIMQNGTFLRRNMRRELVTEEELMSHLREKGIDDIKRVKSAYIESDGKISVVCKNQTTK